MHGKRLRPERVVLWRVLVGCALLQFCGCAGTPRDVGAGSALAVGSTQSSEVSAAAANEPGRAVKILGVQASDFDDRTEIRVLGDGAFSKYHVERDGARSFVLTLEGVRADAVKASIPTPSKRLAGLFLEGLEGDRAVLSATANETLQQLEAHSKGHILVISVYPGRRGYHESPPEAAPAPRKGAEGRVDGSPGASGSGGRAAVSNAPAMYEGYGTPSAMAVSDADILGYKEVYRGKPISLDLQDADIENVLRLLADISGMNIVVEPDVAGRVTLKVEAVPWDQVLDMVLMINGLGKEEIGGVIRVASQEKLKQQWQEREERIKTRQELLRAKRDLGELTTEYLQVNYAEPSEIAAKISETKSDDGKIAVDQRTSLIIYTDYPGRIAEARSLLERLDRPTLQVLIEARIVQLSTTATKELGIDWGLDISHPGGQHPWSGGFAINHPPTEGSSMIDFALGRLGATIWNLDLRLAATEQAGKGKVISAPRVLTMDHVKATISQGTQIPYQEQSEDGISTEFKDATLELQVTPHVTPDGRVRLELQAKKEQPNFVEVIPGQPPAIDTRKIDTELLVEDGHTVVIGGIIEESDEERESRTPGIHKVPLLGRLFKSNTSRLEKNELLIFINPKVVDISGRMTSGGRPGNNLDFVTSGY